ncbi:hypothetical protein [Aquitalea pelogenes]|uniref:hypothetical protein n=1 Tax=Aquitalea pelogenes TaxID=1293573 RepID=UPI0035B4A0A4
MAERKVVKFPKGSSDTDVANGGGGGHNDGMEARVAKLEAIAETTRDKIAGVETRLAVIEKTMATKADVSEVKAYVSEAKNSIIIWVVSAIILAQVVPGIIKAFRPDPPAAPQMIMVAPPAAAPVAQAPQKK